MNELTGVVKRKHAHNVILRNKGITLIALVITIIVLLILAAVSISSLFGENGVITKAKEANIYSAIGKVEDDLKLETLNFDLDLYSDINSDLEEVKSYSLPEKLMVLSIFEDSNEENAENSIIIPIFDDFENMYGIINSNKIKTNLTNKSDKYLDMFIENYEDGDWSLTTIETAKKEFREVFIINNDLKVYYIDKSGKIYPPVDPIPTLFTSDIPIEEPQSPPVEIIDEVGVIPIYTQADLQKIASDEMYIIKGQTYYMSKTAKYSIKNDITITGTFNPIEQFDGVLEGNMNKIKKLSTSAVEELTYFLDISISQIASALILSNVGVIKNIGFENTNINITSNNTNRTGMIRGDLFVAVVAVQNYGTIENCYTTGQIIGDDYVGTIAEVNIGIINNCYNTALVTGGYATGGIVGVASEGKISNCFNIGTISTFDNYGYIGGIAGIGNNANLSNIINCYSIGTITDEYGGGLIGASKETLFENCYWFKSVETSAKAAIGAITSETDKLGITKLNRTEIVTENKFSGFDFSNIWNINVNEPPYLKNLPKPNFNLLDEKIEDDVWEYEAD